MNVRSADVRAVKSLGRDAGFDLVRIASADAMHVERARYLRWLELGRQGEMRWMTPDRARASTDPTSTLPEARSVISVAMKYWSGPRPPDAVNRGRIARYAWGRDYHMTLGESLGTYAETLGSTFGGDHRWYVDTGPLMDKALARRSGVGWYGRNTNILTEAFGSFVLLGEIVSTLELPADRPLDRSCGHCRLCVSACPTGALLGDYTIDARRCISYLTIEHRGPIPLEYRNAIGAWAFGCDVCQDVCPPTMRPHLGDATDVRHWTLDVRSALNARESPGLNVDLPRISNQGFTGEGARQAVDLLWLLRLTHAEYLEAFRGTAIRRAKVWMLRRNAAVALGNVGGPESEAPLYRALCDDEHPVVRGHAAWAMGKLGARYPGVDTFDKLGYALERDEDEAVQREIRDALSRNRIGRRKS